MLQSKILPSTPTTPVGTRADPVPARPVWTILFSTLRPRRAACDRWAWSLGDVPPRQSMRLFTPAILFRLSAALLLAALGEFCVFGFLASLEPGSHLPWQVGYSLVGLCVFFSAVWLGFGAFELERTGWIGVIAGLCLGAIMAFCVLCYLSATGPRGDVCRPLWGSAYGLLGGTNGGGDRRRLGGLAWFKVSRRRLPMICPLALNPMPAPASKRSWLTCWSYLNFGGGSPGLINR